MKKLYFIILSLLLLSIYICTSLNNTSLDNIIIDNITLGDSIDSLDLSKYEIRTDIENEYNYQFKELQIKTDSNNKIKEILLSILDTNFLSISEEKNFSTINQITNILGSNFKESWYDKEQGLKSHKYVDLSLHIKANFIYDLQDNLIWLNLKSY